MCIWQFDLSKAFWRHRQIHFDLSKAFWLIVKNIVTCVVRSVLSCRPKQFDTLSKTFWRFVKRFFLTCLKDCDGMAKHFDVMTKTCSCFVRAFWLFVMFWVGDKTFWSFVKTFWRFVINIFDMTKTFWCFVRALTVCHKHFQFWQHDKSVLRFWRSIFMVVINIFMVCHKHFDVMTKHFDILWKIFWRVKSLTFCQKHIGIEIILTRCGNVLHWNEIVYIQ